MTYLDTNILVYAAINNGKEGEKCRRLLTQISHSDKDIMTSILTWDELVYSIWKKEGREKAVQQGKEIFYFPNLRFLEADIKVIQKAQQIIENIGLKPRDAIHAATAILNNCSEIISDDPDFDKVKEIKRRPI